MSGRGLFLIRCKELFYGDANGSLCRMVTREGGRLGPDVISVCGFPQEYESLTVDTADGKEIKGVTLNEDILQRASHGHQRGRTAVTVAGTCQKFRLDLRGRTSRSPIRALHQLGAPQIMQVHNPLQLPASIHHHQ